MGQRAVMTMLWFLMFKDRKLASSCNLDLKGSGTSAIGTSLGLG